MVVMVMRRIKKHCIRENVARRENIRRRVYLKELDRKLRLDALNKSVRDGAAKRANC